MSSRPPAPRPGAAAGALAVLEELYAQLPALSCLGLCAHSCASHIDASTVERGRLLEVGVDLDAPTPDGSCPALRRTFGAGQCGVHAIRPLICRLWGTSASMPCPHGCRPEGGHVDDATAMRWLLSSFRVGGHRDRLDAPAIEEVMELAVADQIAAGLLARFLRGDRTIIEQLAERIAQLRSLTSPR